jgi:3',5'-cyclic AMP phosphodiesterase CpdA
MLDQEHAVLLVEHDAAGAERHAAGEPPVQMKHPPQRGLELQSQFSDGRHRRDTLTQGAADACADRANLPKPQAFSQPGVGEALATSTAKDSGMTVFTLAHLSDPHLPPLPKPSLGELAGKRVLGYLNWIRNRHSIHRRDVLDALVADLQAQAPDHVAVTGDLVNIALDAEFAPARRWLESVGAADRVSVVPGNHDAYVRATADRFTATFPDYISGDGAAPGFPYLRRRGRIAIVGVSSAVPTAPFMATGRLGDEQRAALETLLQGLSRERAFKVLLIHHPLQSRSRQKRLTDSAELIALLSRHPVDLVLHGHDHVHATIRIDTPAGPIPVIGVPSASALNDHHRPSAAYNLFAISEANDGWRCEHRIRGFGADAAIADLQDARLL